MIRKGLQLVPRLFAPQCLTRFGLKPISFVNKGNLPTYQLLTMRPQRYFAGTLILIQSQL